MAREETAETTNKDTADVMGLGTLARLSRQMQYDCRLESNEKN